MKIEKEEIDETKVTLDAYNSDLNLCIDGSHLSAQPLTFEGFAFMWAGARATHGGLKGKFCFEVKVLDALEVSHLPVDEPSPHVVRVGFSLDSCTLQLGEDPLSYGYGGTGKISTNCQFKDYGTTFTCGDVILGVANMESDFVQLGFAKSGKFLGWAYEFNKSELKGKALYPHILTKNVSFEVNFGQMEKPYFPLPDGFRDYIFIGCLPINLKESGTRAPLRKEDCEMIMMCGLPGAGKSVWAADYSLKHPEKKYNILGTNTIIDKMKVMGLPRKRNYRGRWDVLIQMATKCLNKMFEIGSRLRRNYILDQTNVYPTAQKRKMRNFLGFRRIAVVVVPTDAEYRRRCDKRDREEGKEVPDHAVLEMKANFKLPEVGESFDEVKFTELQCQEAEKLVASYNDEGKAAVGPARKQFKPNDGPGFGNYGSDQGNAPYSDNGGRGGFRGRGGQRGGFDGNRGGFGGNRGGFDANRGGFNRNRGGYGNRGGYDGGRGGYEGGRGGYDGGRGGYEGSRGGYDGGRGGYDSGRGGYEGGRGGYDSGRGGYDSGRGGYDSGRGGYDSGRGGYEGGRGSYDGGRGGYEGGRGGQDGGRGGYDKGRGGYGGSRGGRGGYEKNRGGYNSGYDKGHGGSDGGSRGGFDRNRGGFNGGRGGYDSSRSSYEGGSDSRDDFEGNSRGGYGGNKSGFEGSRGGYDRGRGSYSRGQGGYSEGRGNFQSGQGQKRSYESDSRYDRNESSMGGYGGYNTGSEFGDNSRSGNDYSSSRSNAPEKYDNRGYNSGSSRNYGSEPALGAYDKSSSSSGRGQRGSRGGSFRNDYNSSRDDVSGSRNYGSGGNESYNPSSGGSSYNSSYNRYQSDYNEKSQGSFKANSDSYGMRDSYGSVPPGGIKKEPGIDVASARGSTRSSGRASRWSAEPSSYPDNSSTNTLPDSSSYSAYGAAVKTEPDSNPVAARYDSYPANVSSTYGAYSATPSSNQGFQGGQSYGQPASDPSSQSWMSSQQWTGAQGASVVTSVPPAASQDAMQYYQQAQAQYYSQYRYGQPTAQGYGTGYGAK